MLMSYNQALLPFTAAWQLLCDFVYISTFTKATGTGSVEDPHLFQCGSGHGSSIFVNKFPLLLWFILALLDPESDPYSQCGSGSS